MSGKTDKEQRRTSDTGHAVIRRDSRSVVSSGRKKEKSLGVVDTIRAIDKRREKEWYSGIYRVNHRKDRTFLILVIILVTLGSMMVFSASYPTAKVEHDSGSFYFLRQLFFVALGIGLMLVAAVIPYDFYRRITVPAALVTTGLLVFVLLKGTALGVARRWIVITDQIRLQPSEIAKIALIILLATYIDKYKEDIVQRDDAKKSFFKGVFIPFLMIGFFAGLVLLEKHLSGAIIIVLIGVFITFIAGANFVQMLLLYIPCGAVVGVLYLLKNSYALKRLAMHGNAEANILDEGWQTMQGLYAIGSGGLLGNGFGRSNLKHSYVSEAQNDFIFTIWCEEMGFVGAVVVIILYGLLIWRGFVVAKRAPDTFSALLAAGITFQIGLQAALNMFVVTDIIPNTGISLPFFSYGGTSLVMLLIEAGMLLSVSKHSFQKKT